MKKSILYIASMLVATAGFTSCDDDFERPPMEDYIPHATMVANTTAQELKEAFNQPTNYYNVQIGTKADGSHYIVKGRVTSSDEAGNVYKKLMIEDATGGLIFSIDNSKLYETYRIGQEVIVDVTGLYYGNYGTGMQIGISAEATSAPNRIPKDTWEGTTTQKGICELNGLANPDKVAVPSMTVSEVNGLLRDDATKLAWQGRLVRITGVHFQAPGTLLARVLAAGETNPNNTSYLIDDSNNRIAMNTSSYSTFGTTTKAPKGTGDVVALLTLYNNNWQIVINDLAGLEGFEPWVDEPEKPVEAVGSFSVNFDGEVMPEGWTQKQLAGNKEWYLRTFDNVAYACMTGYKGNAPFDSWLISQPVDAAKMTAKTLSFDTQVNGYGSTTTTFKVFVLDGPDPATANRTELTATMPEAPASGYSPWTNSGTISLAAQSGVFYIGWQYAATQDANYATYGITNIEVK